MHKQGVGEFPFYCGINSLSELATKDDRCVVLNILGKGKLWGYPDQS